MIVHTTPSSDSEYEVKVEATSRRLFNKMLPASMMAANQNVQSATRTAHDQRVAEMQFVSMTQSVAQNAQSNMIGASSLYLESVKVSQQDDHHDKKMATQKKEHGDNLTAHKKHREEKMSLEADQHNDNMTHAEKVEQRSTLKEERLLLRQQFTDFSNKACGLFWLCVIFLVVILMDYHWSHALQDFCSYAEKLNWLRSVVQWMTPLNQSWPMLYVLSYPTSPVTMTMLLTQFAAITLDECTNESCPAA